MEKMKLAALFSGGKDSTYAVYLAKRRGHEISCLITMKSKNPYSYMFHTPAIELTALQAEAMELPIFFWETAGEKEKELQDLRDALQQARRKFAFEGILTGALFSEYQKSRIEQIGKDLGLRVLSPLWHKNQERLMDELLKEGFEFVLTGVAAEGLDSSWLNKIITKKEIEKLKGLNKQVGLNIASEGGESESLVLDCPLFKKRLVLDDTEVVVEDRHTARLIIKHARLVKK